MPWLGGPLAVELFFVLSGFYMQLVLSAKYSRARLGKAWLTCFYRARYFRLLPIYLMAGAIVAAAALVQPLWAPAPLWRFLAELPRTPGNLFFELFLGFTNASMFFQEGVLYMAVHDGRLHWSAHYLSSAVPVWQALLVPQAWSLGLELSFYAVAPFLLNLRSRWLIFACCLSLGLKIFFIKALHFGDPWTYRFFPFELCYFLMGALACRYRARLDLAALFRMDARIGKTCAYLLVTAIAVVSAPGHYAFWIYPMALACVLPFLFRMTSEVRADRLLGELSYPVYIFHIFALTVANSIDRHWWHGAETPVAWLGLVLTLSLSAAALALELRYIEPWRARLSQPRVAGLPRA